MWKKKKKKKKYGKGVGSVLERFIQISRSDTRARTEAHQPPTVFNTSNIPEIETSVHHFAVLDRHTGTMHAPSVFILLVKLVLGPSGIPIDAVSVRVGREI